jgi:ribosomal protein L11 methyltransferase
VSLQVLRFDADAAAADAWSDALLDAGALAVELSDPRAGAPGEVALFDEPGEIGRGQPASAHPPALALWPLSRVSALFAADADPAGALSAAAAALARPLPVAERALVAEQDWVRATQAQFGPIDIGEGLWIVPSWHAPPAAATRVLRLDPGLAFGTGSHPTTRLCLRWLAHGVRPGMRVLDYGCGSGVLAIAAALLGAGEVVGTDIDPQAIGASRANAAANGVAARFALPDALPAGTFDVVVANILANPLVLLAPLLAARTRPGGQIALAGILQSQADAVVAAYTPWFNIARSQVSEGWVLLTGARDATNA